MTFVNLHEKGQTCSDREQKIHIDSLIFNESGTSDWCLSRAEPQSNTYNVSTDNVEGNTLSHTSVLGGWIKH